MKHWHIALSAATTLGLSAIGCGSAGGQSADRMTLQGTVATSEMALDNARAIALSADGHAYAAYLDQNGDFSLQVPTGHAYRVVIANSLASGLHQVVGHVAIRTSRGTSTWLGARAAAKVDLGVLSATQTALRTMSAPCDCDGGTTGGSGGGSGEGDHHGDDDHEHGGDGSGGGYTTSGGGGGNGGGYHGSGSGSGKGDHGDDHECEQDDDEHGKVCTKGGSYDVELSPSNNPGDKCDDKDLDDDKEKKNDEDHNGSCDSKGGSHGGSGSGSGGGYGGSGSGSGGGYSGGSTGGGSGSGGNSYDAGSTTPAPGGCKVNADCGNGACVACACTP